MAEHMLILKLTSPAGEVKYITAAFPSACGKTNLAMLVPTLEGWTVETVGDDIAWMKFGDDGRLYAINPEAGFFGVAPGTCYDDQPERDGHDHQEHRLHQLRPDRRRRHLVGGHDQGSPRAPDRLARQRLGRPAPRRPPRTRTPASPSRPSQAPCIAAEWEDTAGVPIDAILFGGRRATVVPLVRESFDWEHGTFLAATMSSEQTAAAAGTVGQLRFDPFAQLPFAGYNMGDYIAPLAEDRQDRRRQAAEDLLRQLVPQGRRRQLPLAGIRREQPRARLGLPSPRRRGRSSRDADRSRAERAEDLNLDGLNIDAADARGAAHGRHRAGQGRAPAGQGVPRQARRASARTR